MKKSKKMNKWEKILLQIGLFLTVLSGAYWLTLFSEVEKKTSDRIGCSDIQEIFPEKKINCIEIQKRFKQ